MSPEDLSCVVKILLSGQVVALPTETVYGLACLALDEFAVAKVYKAFVYNSPPVKGDAFYHLMKELEWRAQTLGVMQGFTKVNGV